MPDRLFRPILLIDTRVATDQSRSTRQTGFPNRVEIQPNNETDVVSYDYVIHVGKIIDATIERRPQRATLHNTIHLMPPQILGSSSFYKWEIS